MSWGFRVSVVGLLLLAGVFGSSYHNHYPADLVKDYKPVHKELPEGYGTSQPEELVSESLYLGEIQDRRFWQYTEGEQVFYFTTDSNNKPIGQTHSVASSTIGEVSNSGITFHEQIGNMTVLAWFPGVYDSSNASKPFAVSMASEDERDQENASWVESLITHSPFHNSTYQVTSPNGTVVDFRIPTHQKETIEV